MTSLAILAGVWFYAITSRFPSQPAIENPSASEQASGTFERKKQVPTVAGSSSSVEFSDASSTVGPDTSNWQTYNSNTCGFALKYPSDWILSSPTEWGGIPASGNPTRCESGFGLGDSAGDNEISVEIEPLDTTATYQTTSLSDYLRALMASTSTGSTYASVKMNSIEGRKVVWLKSCGRTNLICSTILYFQNMETLFEIDVPGYVPEDNAMIGPILGTFHFLGSK